MHELKLHNLKIWTNEKLSMARAGKLVSAVQQARGMIANACLKTGEALGCLTQPDIEFQDLPPRLLSHFGVLFRCEGDEAAFRRTLGRVYRLLTILHQSFNSPALEFREYGSDLVSTIVDKAGRLFANTGLYQPSDVAMVRGISIARVKNYVGPSRVDECLSRHQATGNPNEIQIRLTSLDELNDELVDTIIHEGTHKFLGTEDEGMNSTTFDWMAEDGLATYREEYPGIPLPIDRPGFTSKDPESASANAYLLTAYIRFFPEGDITTRTRLNQQARSGHLGNETELGRLFREGAARQRPPEPAD